MISPGPDGSAWQRDDVLNKGTITPLSGNTTNFFKNGATQYDAIYRKSGVDTYVYVDANGDGSFKTAHDVVIKLSNFTETLTDGNFIL